MSAAANPLGVPAHQHVNPDGSVGGWVADTAHIDPTVHVAPRARIYGGTIRGGTIRGGTIWGGTIWGGTIWGGTIRGSRDVLVVGPIGSEDQWATLTRTDDGHLLTVGCWHDGTIDTLEAEVMRRAPECWPEYEAVRALLRLRVAEWAAADAANGAAS